MVPTHYTPTVDELCIGFRFEIPTEKGIIEDNKVVRWEPSWGECELFGVEGIPEIARDLDMIRVKYLDTEDIESLGFKLIEDRKEGKATRMNDKGYSIVFSCDLREEFPITTVIIYDSILNMYNGILHPKFNGSIKNKFELEKILKQVCK